MLKNENKIILFVPLFSRFSKMNNLLIESEEDDRDIFPEVKLKQLWEFNLILIVFSIL